MKPRTRSAALRASSKADIGRLMPCHVNQRGRAERFPFHPPSFSDQGAETFETNYASAPAFSSDEFMKIYLAARIRHLERQVREARAMVRSVAR